MYSREIIVYTIHTLYPTLTKQGVMYSIARTPAESPTLIIPVRHVDHFASGAKKNGVDTISGAVHTRGKRNVHHTVHSRSPVSRKTLHQNNSEVVKAS